ncbi:MAG: DNA-binding helix-turn-helix protein [Parcubacteria group bacterium GW2011_GWA1_53_13]|nr:MAG: DNA-binding helix-turn-helix protein [Parcubacteria group bacterium GW2011_GWA1_53_13]
MKKITLSVLKRELLKNKKTRKAYEANELEHEVISAMIQARITCKLSQGQLARKTQMHQSAIARFESGNSNPRLDTLARIANALDVQLIK